jgi:hypothetical protein
LDAAKRFTASDLLRDSGSLLLSISNWLPAATELRKAGQRHLLVGVEPERPMA